MSITFESGDSPLVATLRGRLDSTNAATIEGELLGKVNGGSGGLVLDFSGLDYISSAGLRVVLVVAKRMKQAGGSFVLAGLQPHIKDVFEIAGFLSILEVAGNKTEALARF